MLHFSYGRLSCTGALKNAADPTTRSSTDDGTPTTIRNIGEEELRVDITVAFRATPTQVSRAATNKTSPSVRTTFVAFRRSDVGNPPARVKLFCVRLPVYARRLKPKVSRCTRCPRYHCRELCTFDSWCPICASHDHTEENHPRAGPNSVGCSTSPDECACPPRCAKCCGLQDARDPTCPVWHTINPYSGWVHRPTQAVTRKSRKAGEGLWTASNSCIGRRPHGNIEHTPPSSEATQPPSPGRAASAPAPPSRSPTASPTPESC
jgi:hypothetical protein